MNSPKNILTEFLALLKIKHTRAFSTKHFEENPNKYNLFGVSKMLTNYGIENTGLILENKDQLVSLDAPFIAQVSNDLVVVSKLNSDKVDYRLQDKHISIPVEDFKELWSGVILLAEPDEKSIEPGYKQNRINEVLVKAQNVSLLIIVAALSVLAFYLGKHLYDWKMIAMLLLNAVGLYVSYLLVLKQMNINSNHADKLCSLFKKGDCNDVLESPAAKFLGLVGWSEVGLAYFSSNTIIILFFPALLPYMMLINICALPYSFWSVWYQKFRAKQWCSLCLIVMTLLWTVFISGLLAGYITLPLFRTMDIGIVLLIYITPFLVIRNLVLAFTDSIKNLKITYEFNGFKMNEEVFTSLLKEQPYHEADLSTSQIIFGNPEAKMRITIFTNPLCNPCAKMHKRIEAMLEKSGDNLCIQYVLSSFGEKYDEFGQKLVSIYLNDGAEVSERAFHEWFEGGKSDPASFFKKYNCSDNDSEAEKEYLKHKLWGRNNKLTGTPSIVVGNHMLPDNYKIEDMIYFTELDIDAK